ncbi:MAG TPA: endonuclease [Panacibacter sp.]|nr:endonuclease [Panacibacter sp.]HNP46437.1 endonuclease [Panacibacter sp.]
MPEGPSIVLLKEAAQQFAGQKIIAVSGDSKIDHSLLLNKKVLTFNSWGKHFLICLKDLTIRIHLLMFGSYRINEQKPGKTIRLSLRFKTGEINFYTCSIVYLPGDPGDHYDWSADVMSDEWDAGSARKKLKKRPGLMACDALLEQDIFAGVGNIIKNEVLYRIRVHPESLVNKLPAAKLKEMISESRIYSFQFLEWKRNNELKKHWLAHTKKLCLRCKLPFIKKYTGVKKRRSFICENCQVLYT